MNATKFDSMAREGNYRRIGMFPMATGQAYLAEKIIHTPEGAQFEMLWAVGKDADHLEIAQKITFNYHSTKSMRSKHALEKATEYLAIRDYAGDTRRQSCHA